MENQGNESPPGFKSFAFKRLFFAAILIILVIWALSAAPGMKRSSTQDQPSSSQQHTQPQPPPDSAPEPAASRLAESAPPKTTVVATPGRQDANDHATGHGPDTKIAAADDVHGPKALHTESDAEPTATRQTAPADHSEPATPTAAKPHAEPKKETAAEPAPEKSHAPAATQDQTHGASPEAGHVDRPVGVAFVDSVIHPLQYELNERWWGWRPNDIINLTDNVNHYQRGALEVTRRSVVLLSERIARTGTTDAFNPHLENAMNWLMIKADRYWFPAPETKYKESIRELGEYKQELENGRASFHIRTDNIIPLLASYEDLLGSCDENLVKQKEEDGTKVSYFKADDYFFYAKGVAGSMAGILEAIHHDFEPTLKSRHAEELLHHAIVSCRQAADMDPLVITNSDLDGIFANHRAHLAAPISHARFYIGLLIKTLST